MLTTSRTPSRAVDGKLRTLKQFEQLFTANYGGDVRSADANMESLHRKTRELADADVLAFIRGLGGGTASANISQTGRLYPTVKSREYMEGAAVQLQAKSSDLISKYSMPLDPATKSLHLIATRRQSETKLPGGQTSFQAALMLEGSREQFLANLAEGFSNMLEQRSTQPPSYEDSHGIMITVRPGGDDQSVICHMATHSFVDELRKGLSCQPIDELVVVPLSSHTCYATKSSSPMGCCMLGDYADGLSAHQPDHMSCVPFRVLSIDRSASETELLKAGKLPVTWEQYPYWGQEPVQGVRDDGCGGR